MTDRKAAGPHYVIFDMDGVIFDTEQFYIDCCVPAAEKVGLTGMREVALGCIGLTVEETEKRLIAAYGENAPLKDFHEETFRIFRRRYEEKGLPIKPGVREILSWLREAGTKVALASSTYTDTVRTELADADLIDYFDVIIGGDMAKRSKPAPDIFLQAAEALGADPSECFIIEDSFNGIRAAFAAGARPLMVPDLLEPDEEIRGMAEAVFPSLYEVLKLFREGTFEV